jgi:hypothetical protein
MPWLHSYSVLRNWFRQPRVKRYAARSGYLYEYIFEGVEDDTDYKFRASVSENTELAISVTLEKAALDEWARRHRQLGEIDRFGIAKMALLRAFDACTHPDDLRAPVRPSHEEITAICAELDF